MEVSAEISQIPPAIRRRTWLVGSVFLEIEMTRVFVWHVLYLTKSED